MDDSSMDQYIQQGIYGTLETKKDERRLFLGSIRERVIIALTIGQVRRKAVYKEVEQALNSNKEAKLLLNGQMNYGDFSKYIQLANKSGNDFTIVSDSFHPLLGLVLAAPTAVDKDKIYIEDEIFRKSQLSNKK
ncbi:MULTISPECIES: YueI family protein [Bacillus]|uniref:DUF1694 domain-containing protein n=2 Tax=Bacillus TaxID=1386 RepID=A0A0M4FUT8_9BACI|nr:MULTISPECIES: YueI family protein [Bacillus]ALC82218.1 hypothetical protein AM592_11990 [Bacillus gobiensis]MBP1081061.1 uncharacterized protein YueI [Bacillus capparidis]MED1095751.1 YueI family protein [Bacillus capparidis]